MPKPNPASYQRCLEEHGPAYRMDLSYIGTSFSGFQSQVDGNAVQDHVEKALATLLRHKVRIRGASRTDRGVHAHEQVAVFRTKVPFSQRWLLGLNALLPSDIGAHSLAPVADDFDPIFDAKGKMYRYRLWTGRSFNPFIKPFVWPVPYAIDLEVFQQEARKLVGRHDFAAFCNSDSDAKTTVRRVLEVHLEQQGPLLDFWICGEGFLKQMVRIIVGTLVEIAAGKLPRNLLDELLANGDRVEAGTTAPAKGLSLVKIFYEDVPPIANLVKAAQAGFCLPFFDPPGSVMSVAPQLSVE